MSDLNQSMLRAVAGLFLLMLMVLGCEGQGDDGGAFRIVIPGTPECTPAAGQFPSGLVVLSSTEGRALLIQDTPPGLRPYAIDGDRPEALAFENIGSDSDSDGEEDASTLQAILGFPLQPVTGEVSLSSAAVDAVALVSTSNFEQVLVADPLTGQTVPVRIEVDAAIPANRFPLLPAPGTSAMRTGISTFACLFPEETLDSAGQPIGPEDFCDPDETGFFSNLTAGKAVAGGRLFVATSNLNSEVRFFPGSVLVFEWSELAGEITVRPSIDTPVLWTSGYNPTGMTRIETPGGRELVLVTVTGAIGSGTGASNIVTEAFVDVIDPQEPRIVARIPLGFAGPSFDAPSVDPGGRLAWLGASSQRQLYAVDLRALDDDALFATASGGTGSAGDPARTLDGMDLVGADARIFDADRPLVIPARTDRPAPSSCAGFTSVAVNSAGDEAYATDFCDGTLTRVRYDASEPATLPYPTSRFQIGAQLAPYAPISALEGLRAPSTVVVRSGRPGVDFTGPDVFVLAGQPEANLCSLRIESEAPVE